MEYVKYSDTYSTQEAGKQIDNDIALLINPHRQRFQIATCKAPTNHN